MVLQFVFSVQVGIKFLEMFAVMPMLDLFLMEMVAVLDVQLDAWPALETFVILVTLLVATCLLEIFVVIQMLD